MNDESAISLISKHLITLTEMNQTRWISDDKRADFCTKYKGITYHITDCMLEINGVKSYSHETRNLYNFLRDHLFFYPIAERLKQNLDALNKD